MPHANASIKVAIFSNIEESAESQENVYLSVATSPSSLPGCQAWVTGQAERGSQLDRVYMYPGLCS